jgi:hypothetical protein
MSPVAELVKTGAMLRKANRDVAVRMNMRVFRDLHYPAWPHYYPHPRSYLLIQTTSYGLEDAGNDFYE